MEKINIRESCPDIYVKVNFSLSRLIFICQLHEHTLPYKKNNSDKIVTST